MILELPISGRLLSLQVLRAIAAIMVVVCHLYGFDQRFFGGPVMPAGVQFGLAGVDLFFILSGFVMVYITRPGSGNVVDVRAFLFSRVARIYPLWWLALGASSVVFFVRPATLAGIGGAPNLLADFVLWPHERLPLLTVGWTLIHEMYFYLVFTLLLLLPPRHFFLGLGGWLTVVVSSNLLINAFGVSASAPLLLITNPLALEFGAGAMIGLLSIKGIRPSPRILITLGIACLVLIYLINHDSPLTLFDTSWFCVLTFGPSWALVLWGMVGLEINSKRVPMTYLGIIGDASYSLYITHILVLALIARLLAPLCGPAIWDNLIAWIVLLSASALVALLTHRYVEKPMLKYSARIRVRFFPEVNKSLMNKSDGVL